VSLPLALTLPVPHQVRGRSVTILRRPRASVTISVPPGHQEIRPQSEMKMKECFLADKYLWQEELRGCSPLLAAVIPALFWDRRPVAGDGGPEVPSPAGKSPQSRKVPRNPPVRTPRGGGEERRINPPRTPIPFLRRQLRAASLVRSCVLSDRRRLVTLPSRELRSFVDLMGRPARRRLFHRPVAVEGVGGFLDHLRRQG